MLLVDGALIQVLNDLIAAIKELKIEVQAQVYSFLIGWPVSNSFGNIYRKILPLKSKSSIGNIHQ